MKNDKVTMKNRLSLLLPFGFVSKYTLNFIPPFSNDAACIYDPHRPLAELELSCKKNRENRLCSIRRMESIGLIQSTNWKCGTSAHIKRPFYLLTKTGMTTLAGAQDNELDSNQIISLEGKCAQLSHYRSYTDEALTLRNEVFSAAEEKAIDPCKNAAFNLELLNAIRMGECTPLAAALPELCQYSYNTAKYSQNQLYAVWRNSHIDAMFRVNDFLTFVDRRQYDCGFALDGIASENGLEAYISKYGMTAAAISHIAMTRWYRDHPAANSYSASARDTEPIPYNQWCRTPSYYATREIPGYDGLTKLEDENAKVSEFTSSLHSFTGLITGTKQNYICYHAKPGAFTWNPHIEKTTKENIALAIEIMNKKSAVPAASTTADNALIFCTTYHQFLNIFERTAERHAKGRVGNYITSQPYSTMNIVPVNDSGAFLLRCLALSSPYEVTTTIRNHLINANERFRYNENRVYPVTYDYRNVFVGHTMDVNLINTAYEDYLDGRRFYISCFPEQAMWYRKLMPENELL